MDHGALDIGSAYKSLYTCQSIKGSSMQYVYSILAYIGSNKFVCTYDQNGVYFRVSAGPLGCKDRVYYA
jgi:hypothetical protein